MRPDEFAPLPPPDTRPTPSRSLIGRVLEGLVVAIILAGFLFCAVIGAQMLRDRLLPMSADHICRHNVRQLAIAVQMYHDAHGCYPPAYVADADGKRMHSWRALVLPFLDDPDAKKAGKDYRLREPWNSKHNRAIAMPDVFRFANDSDDSSETRYMAVVGEHTMWPGATSVTRADLHDGPEDIICIVEAGETVPWLEPRDISPKEFIAGLSKTSHQQGTLAAMADGNVVRISPESDPKIVQALLTPAGGERVNTNEVTAD